MCFFLSRGVETTLLYCFSVNFCLYIFLCYLFLLYLHSKETDCESHAHTLLQESVLLTPIIYIY